MTLPFWQVEYTDLFAGQANYSWVCREEIAHNRPLSDRALTRKFKAALGLTGIRGRSYWRGDQWEFRPYGRCTVAFATLVL